MKKGDFRLRGYCNDEAPEENQSDPNMIVALVNDGESRNCVCVCMCEITEQ